MGVISNLFAGIAARLPEEQLDLLHDSSNVRIERIVSRGHASSPGFWFDQPLDEWVVVIEGAGQLQFEGEPESRNLRAGDFVYIPAHRRHRVVWTEPSHPTIWLAIHFPPPP